MLAKLPGALAQLEEADAAARRVSVDLRESEDKEAAEPDRCRHERANRADRERPADRRAGAARGRGRPSREGGVAGGCRCGRARPRCRRLGGQRHGRARDGLQRTKTNAAAAAFTDAQAALEELAATYDDVDLAGLLGYVAKRIEAMGYALASDDAFLAKNKEEAVSQNDAYNRADADAAALAAALPDDVAQLVFEAYEQATDPFFETYSTARSQAGAADAFLRDYLGTTSK